jgi:hypothetical protein
MLALLLLHRSNNQPPLGVLALSGVILASVSLKRGEEAAGGKTGGSGSSFILSSLVVQDLDKLAVIDSSSCKCIVNSLYLNRSTQWYCSESGEMNFLSETFGFKKHVMFW